MTLSPNHPFASGQNLMGTSPKVVKFPSKGSSYNAGPGRAVGACVHGTMQERGCVGGV